MKDFKDVIVCLAAAFRQSSIKSGRTFSDFAADRIRQAASKRDLISFFQRIVELMDTNIGYIKKTVYTDFLVAAKGKYRGSILTWLRDNPDIGSMLCTLKEEDLDNVLPEVEADIDADSDVGTATRIKEFDINLRIKCLSLLSHGDDVKSGNATLFRRMAALTDKGRVVNLPFYAGNAIRGQIRDLLADWILKALGLEINRIEPILSLWFFHVLYSGGTLSESMKNELALMKELGNQSANTDGINRVRNWFPSLSILGFSAGNKIIPGRINVNDLRPVCHEWGFANAPSVYQLLTWAYFTRRHDLETVDEEIKNESMIVNTECLAPGTELFGGIDVSRHATEVEISALFLALDLLKKAGSIGACSRQGYGKIEISITSDIKYDPKLYPEYIKENKQEILTFMNNIGAFFKPETFDEAFYKSKPDDDIAF